MFPWEPQARPTLTYANGVIYGGHVGSCGISLIFGGARHQVTEASHIGATCQCDQPLVEPWMPRLGWNSWWGTLLPAVRPWPWRSGAVGETPVGQDHWDLLSPHPTTVPPASQLMSGMKLGLEHPEASSRLWPFEGYLCGFLSC